MCYIYHHSSLIAHSSRSNTQKRVPRVASMLCILCSCETHVVSLISKSLCKLRGPQQYNPGNGDNNRIIQSCVQDTAIHSGRRMGYAYQFTIILSANAISRENLPTSYSSVIATVINILLLYQLLLDYTFARESTINRRKGI